MDYDLINQIIFPGVSLVRHKWFYLSRLASHCAELAHKGSIGLEDLDSVVLLVADVDEAQRVCGDAPGVAELSIGGTLTAERSQEMSKRIENLNSVIVTIGDDVLPDPVYSNSGQAIELAVSIAVTAEAESMLSDLVEDLNPVVGRIRNNDAVVRTDSDASWPREQTRLASSAAKCHEKTLLLQVLTSWPGKWNYQVAVCVVVVAVAIV